MRDIRYRRLTRRMARDTRAEIASEYLTPVELAALRHHQDGVALARIGRSLGIVEELADELVTSARRKRAAGAQVGAASLRRSGRMARNQTRWARGITAELERRRAAGRAEVEVTGEG